MPKCRKTPCPACPYRQDAPSGVWAHEEYEKLRAYDRPTMEQPPHAFVCHATPRHLCHGWAIVHTSRGHAFDLLALRLTFEDVECPEPAVPLFSSGQEAADHGQRDIAAPSDAALDAMGRLLRYPRLARRATAGAESGDA